MTTESNTATATNVPLDTPIIPDYLVKETIDGIPFYYKGFREVLNKTKNKVDIMADSGLQIFIKSWILGLLLTKLDNKKYYVFTGEMGVHLSKNNNLSLDLTVYDKSVLTPDKINNKFVDVPPKIVIEIDVNVEMVDPNSNTFDEFVLRKVRKLHDFGTKKLIWIFTKSRSIIIAKPNGKWEVKDWTDDIEVLDGVKFNVAKHLDELGIDY